MARLFLGGLKEGASRTELERQFEAFGPLREVWVARKPPGFGFILFEESRDADDALREMNGRYVCGGRIRVEYARDSGQGRGRGGGGSGGYGGGKGGQACQNCGRFGHSSRDCKKGTSQTYGYNGEDRDYRGDRDRRDSRSHQQSNRRRSRSYDRDRKSSQRRKRSQSRSRSKDRKSRQ